MQHIEKLVTLLVKRLGGRVEFSPDEIDAIGEGGEQLLSYRTGLERLEVLEVRQLEVLKVQPPPETVHDDPGRLLARFDSPEGKQWRADVTEKLARRAAGLPDPTGVLRESYERMQEWADTRQPVEGRERVLNGDTLED